MKTKNFNLALVILFFLTANLSYAQIDTSPSQQIIDAYTGAFAASDVDALMNLYTQDASIRNSDGSMVSGIDNITVQYKGFLEGAEYIVTLKTTDETMMGDDYLFTSGSYALSGTDAKGTAVMTGGVYVNACKKIDGKWKILKSYRFLDSESN